MSEEKTTKDVVIRMRVTEEKREEIKKYCKDNNMSISELLAYGLECVMINENELE